MDRPAARPVARRGLGGLTGDRAVGVLLVLVSACGFGSGALFARPIYASGMDWLGLLAWRFLFGALASWLWLLAVPAHRQALRRMSRRRICILLGLGTLYIGNSGTYFAALETVPASLAALIVYIYPALVAVLSMRFARRLEGGRRWVALGLVSLGVALAVGGIDPASRPPLSGILLAVASPIIYSIWIILSARLSGERPERHDRDEDAHPAPTAAVMLTATFAIWWLAATLGGRPVHPADVPVSAWLPLLGVGVISTAVALQAFYAGARRIGAAQAALVSTVEPIYTITLATLLFAERLTPVQVVGGALVIGGVLIAQTTPGRAEPEVHADL